MTDQLWTKKDVARYLGVSQRTVDRIPREKLPRVDVTGGKRPTIRYIPLDARAYAEQSRQTTSK